MGRGGTQRIFFVDGATCLLEHTRTHARTHHGHTRTPAHPHSPHRRTAHRRTDSLSHSLSLTQTQHTHTAHTHMRNVIRATLRRAVPRTKKTYLLQPLVVDRCVHDLSIYLSIYLSMWRLCAPSLPLQVLIGLLLDPILAARQVRVHLVAEPAGRGVTHACVEEAVGSAEGQPAATYTKQERSWSWSR